MLSSNHQIYEKRKLFQTRLYKYMYNLFKNWTYSL